MSEQEVRIGSLDVETYRSLVEGIPAILYIDEPDEVSSNRYTSPQIVDLLGFSLEEWTSDSDLWIRQLHDDDRARVIAENNASNATGARYFSEYRMHARDGHVLWIRDEAVLVHDEHGTPLYWRGVMQDITQQKEAEEKLRWSLEVLRRTSQQRRELLERLEDAQEEERRRIAADIHDDSVQVMSAVDMRLQLLAQGKLPADVEQLEDLHRIVLQAIERLRHLLFELRPADLDREGLAPALKVYLEHTAMESGVDWSLDTSGLIVEPPPDVRATLFRIAQETIVNVRKHAAASRVDVVVASAGTGVLLRISDDGEGFDPLSIDEPKPGHLGLATTIERAEVAGGWCRFATAPGAGTSMECWLPIEDPATTSA